VLADLHEVLRDRIPARNVVIAAIAEEVVGMLKVFAQRGFKPFIEEWRGLDVLANAPVKVLNGSDATLGIARGVEDDGALLVEVNGEVRRFVSGDVSLRRSEQRTADGER
jgi:BirA family transcriptional regulator, biotin operon repressor / biotin---[acetyl-CoA-carboxylase] ligase